MRSPIKRLSHQWPLKLLALALAVFFWAYVRENPRTQERLHMQVVPINTPEELAVLKVQPEAIWVRAKSRRLSISEAELRAIELVADLTGAGLGEQLVPITIEGRPGDIEIIPEDSVVRVTLDKLISQPRPVLVETTGVVAEGYRDESPQVQPDQVVIRGAASQMGEVARLVAVVDISNATATVQRQTPVQVRDEENVRIGGLTIEPAQVQVTIPVSAVATWSVTITANLSDPPPGYQIDSVRLDPKMLTITGVPSRAREVEHLSTERIDISNLRDTQTFTADLEFPAGVRSMGIAAVSVTVAVKELPSPPEESEPGVTPEEGPPTEERPAPRPGEGETRPTPPAPSAEAPSS